MARVRYAPLGRLLPAALEKIFDYDDAAVSATGGDSTRLSQLSVGLQFLARQWEDVTVALFDDGPAALRSRVASGEFAASASGFAEMFEAVFEKGAVREDAASGGVERWAVKVWPWDLDAGRDLGRFFGTNALLCWYPLRVVADRAASTLSQLPADGGGFLDFAKKNPAARLCDGDFVPAAPPAVPPVPPPATATVVALTGLARADLNGRRGTVEGRAAGGRVGVRLPGHPKLLSVKVANLVPLDPSALLPPPPQRRSAEPRNVASIHLGDVNFGGGQP